MGTAGTCALGASGGRAAAGAPGARAAGRPVPARGAPLLPGPLARVPGRGGSKRERCCAVTDQEMFSCFVFSYTLKAHLAGTSETAAAPGRGAGWSGLGPGPLPARDPQECPEPGPRAAGGAGAGPLGSPRAVAVPSPGAQEVMG